MCTKSVRVVIAGMCLGAATGCQPPTPPQQNSAVAPPTEVIAEQALAGVGKRGQSLEGTNGAAKIISGPVSVLFKFEQKSVLEIQIPKALQLFQATEGRMPKSHQEFMEQIVQANRLVLPELPEGAVYRFNTEKGELWVYPEAEAPN